MNGILKRRELAVFVLFLICYSYFYLPAGWNENSRYDLTYSMVENGTFRIGSYHENTHDKSFLDGHYYSDKAPGSSFFGAVAYSMLAPFSGPGPVAEYFIRFLVVSLPSAFLCVLIYRLSGEFTKRERYRVLVTLAYGLGTMAFPYSLMFYGHQIASVLLFSCFYLLFTRRGRIGDYGLFACGLMMGAAFMTEFPAAIISVFLFFYAFAVLENKEKISFLILGIIPPLIILAAYNFLCFGGMFSTGYSYLAYQESAEFQSAGFLGVSLPDPLVLLGILFSPYRGLFFFSPFLLLCIPGFHRFYRNNRLRKEFWLFLLSVLSFILWNAGYSVWWGGWSPGPRHLVPVIPFMVVTIMLYSREFSGWKEKFAVLLAAASIVLTFSVTVTDPFLPEGAYNPLVQHTIPLLARGDFAFNAGNLLGLGGLLSLVPLLAALAVILWILSGRRFLQWIS